MRRVLGVVAVVVCGSVGVGVAPAGSAPSCEARIYVTNYRSGTLSVFDAATNPPTPVVGSPVSTGTGPRGVAVSPDGTRVYVTNFGSNTLSVFDAATNTQVAGSPVPTGDSPEGVAVSPDGTRI
ncbi:MAG TPA: YncE family protein [Acidimicrobiia bacterium]|nr:YncE family protein [Acidimicrobiia bacterium]